MLTLLFNPNDELKLINYSKEVLRKLTKENQTFYISYPLWISLADKSYTKEELKAFAKTIKGLYIEEALFNETSLYCPVKIITEEKTIYSSLTLLKKYSFSASEACDKAPQSTNNKEEKKITAEENKINFPMQLKIFRIANAIEISKNTKALSDFVWKKL